jgi:hypothetical protein
MPSCPLLPSLLVVALVTTPGAVARADEGAHAGGEEAAEHHPHHHHDNHVALFLGATSGLGDMATTHFTVGADYERRLPFASRLIGIGGLVDSAIGTDVETLIAPFVSVHPIGGLMVLGAVGVAVTGLGHNGHVGLRGGAAYFIPIGGFAAGPVVNVDHVAGETAIVYGASLGAGF